MWILSLFLVVFCLLIGIVSNFSSPSLYVIAGLSGDQYSLFLCLILFFFFIIFYFDFLFSFGVSGSILLGCSLFFCFICFLTNNLFFFWFSYEMTILPLLLLLFLKSPYSERYLAGWYFLGYALATSLPFLLLLAYVSYYNHDFSISSSHCSPLISFFLFMVFITKIPLPPFHTWLPIVHAEASSPVSIYLSGSVMKLGLIGIYRFSLSSFSSLFYYICFCFFCSFLFLISSGVELDAKRWLALLSLAHIIICVIGLAYCSFDSVSLIALFCLGHGFSAGSLFYIIQAYYLASGSRNWLIWVENNNSSLIALFILVLNMLTLVSFPISFQFLSEINILLFSLWSLSLVIFFSLYLFLSGIIPLLLFSLFFSRQTKSVNSGVSFTTSSFLILFYLPLICLVGGVFI